MKTVRLKSSTKEVSDVIARLIMGTTETAMKQLKKLLPIEESENLAGMEPSEYNKRYKQLFTDIDNAIKKALK